jgi:single-stranded-DNA-specific exonuclease
MALWRIAHADERVVSRFSREGSIPRPLATILACRGIATVSALRVFQEPQVADLHDPLLMNGMGEAIGRLLQARERGERVLLFGDYDVDGVASTAAMGKLCESLGLRYAFCHPDRFSEGYGFNRRGVTLAAEGGFPLIVTLDCGTESRGPIAEARALGIDTLVIDHHLQKGDLPPATAVVNPKKESCPYPFEGLVSASVVLKLARALVEVTPLTIPWREILQLAALATVADVAPLRDENRIIAMLGLDAVNSSPLPGIDALARAASVRVDRLGPGHFAFQLGPRLNAAGRLGKPELATMLLLESDREKCEAIADELNRLNSARQGIEKSIVEEAIEQIEGRVESGTEKVLVVAGRNWHRGVVGIVAARLIERYYRPAVVIALEEEMGHGSARSIPEFDLFGGLSRCSDLFATFGGHRHAAGLSIPAENIDPFRERINAVANELLGECDLVPKLDVDVILDLSELTLDLIRRIERMEPFGCGNPRPVIASEGVRIVRGPRTMGRNGSHLKLTIAPHDEAGPLLECVGWRMAGRLPDMPSGLADIAYAPQVNEWDGVESVRLVLKDLRPHGEDSPHAAR